MHTPSVDLAYHTYVFGADEHGNYPVTFSIGLDNKKNIEGCLFEAMAEQLGSIQPKNLQKKIEEYV